MSSRGMKHDLQDAICTLGLADAWEEKLGSPNRFRSNHHGSTLASRDEVGYPSLKKSPKRGEMATSIAEACARGSRPGNRGGVLKASASVSKPDMKMMVCGGSGVAAQVVSRSVSVYGLSTVAMRRNEETRETVESAGAQLMLADALDAQSVQSVFDTAKPSVVISSVGGSPQDPRADSEGNLNLIENALRTGVTRFVLVSSIGAGDSKAATPEQVYSALEPVLLEKEKAENRLVELQSQMSFTVLRPGGLKSEDATGNGVLTEDLRVIGSINRAVRYRSYSHVPVHASHMNALSNHTAAL